MRSPASWSEGELQPGGLAFYTFADIYPRAMPRILDHHLSKGHVIEVALYDAEVSPDYHHKLSTLLALVADSEGASLVERAVGSGYWFTLEPGVK